MVTVFLLLKDIFIVQNYKIFYDKSYLIHHDLQTPSFMYRTLVLFQKKKALHFHQSNQVCCSLEKKSTKRFSNSNKDQRITHTDSHKSSLIHYPRVKASSCFPLTLKHNMRLCNNGELVYKYLDTVHFFINE